LLVVRSIHLFPLPHLLHVGIKKDLLLGLFDHGFLVSHRSGNLIVVVDEISVGLSIISLLIHLGSSILVDMALRLFAEHPLLLLVHLLLLSILRGLLVDSSEHELSLSSSESLIILCDVIFGR